MSKTRSIKIKADPTKPETKPKELKGVTGNSYAEAKELYLRVISTNSKIELKGKTLPYTSINGNMFSALYQDGTVGIRLPEDERIKFLKKYKSTQPIQHGSVLKEYVLVPPDLLAKTGELRKYLDLSFEYAQGLKAKK